MFIRKTTKLLLITALVLAICALVSFAQQESGGRTALTVGDDKFNENEVRESGGRTALTVGDDKFNENEVMDMLVDIMGESYMTTKDIISQSLLKERRQEVTEISDILLLAEVAKAEGLHMLPTIAFQIKWQIAEILTQAYCENLGGKGGFSTEAIQKHYNEHKSHFVRPEAVEATGIRTETKSHAIEVAREARNENGFDSAAEIYGNDADDGIIPYFEFSGWVQKGVMPPGVEEAIMNGRPGQIVGPVQSEGGWLVILIGERRPARQLTFEEAKNVVTEAMEKYYMEPELVKIREKRLAERQEAVIKISDILLLAGVAKAEGLHMLPTIAFQIKWHVARILTQAYCKNLEGKSAFSPAAIQKYYNEHKSDFIVPEGVKATQILTETESDAIELAREARNANGFDTIAEIYGDDEKMTFLVHSFGWVEKGMMPPEVEEAVMNGHTGQIVGPVQSEEGWHVVLIHKREPVIQRTFEEARCVVRGTMERRYIETELVKIRKKHPVEIDDEVLGTLCGIPVEALAD